MIFRADLNQRSKMTNKKEQPKLDLYDIRLECLVPITLTYRVQAENQEKALAMVDKQMHNNMKPNLSKKIKLNAKVYRAGTVNLLNTKVYKVR